MTARILGPVKPLSPVVLEGRHLTKNLRLRQRRVDTGPRRVVHALDDVTIQLRAGEIVALAGESGSGKSAVVLLDSAPDPDRQEDRRSNRSTGPAHSMCATRRSDMRSHIPRASHVRPSQPN